MMKAYYSIASFILIVFLVLLDTSECAKKKRKTKKNKSNLNLPKKYKDLADRSLYCSVCNQLLLEAELLLVDNKDAKFEYQNYGHRIDSRGNRIKKSSSDYGLSANGNPIVYPTHTILPIVEDISKNCDKWSKQTGTESRSDGTVRMLKTDRITGSFSGSLNLGGDSSTKISSMCHDIMSKFDEDMIEILKENNLRNLETFCDIQIDPLNTLDKVCERAEFTPDIIRNIRHVNDFKEKQRAREEAKYADEDEDNDDVVELTDDKGEL